MGRAAHSGKQTTLYLSPLHGRENILKPMIANIHAALQNVRAAAEQFKITERGAVMLRLATVSLEDLPSTLPTALVPTTV